MRSLLLPHLHATVIAELQGSWKHSLEHAYVCSWMTELAQSQVCDDMRKADLTVLKYVGGGDWQIYQINKLTFFLSLSRPYWSLILGVCLSVVNRILLELKQIESMKSEFWNYGFFKNTKIWYVFILIIGVGIWGCFPGADYDLFYALAKASFSQLQIVSASVWHLDFLISGYFS